MSAVSYEKWKASYSIKERMKGKKERNDIIFIISRFRDDSYVLFLLCILYVLFYVIAVYIEIMINTI